MGISNQVIYFFLLSAYFFSVAEHELLQDSGHCFGRASVILQLSTARAELHKYRKMCYELEAEHVKDQARLVDYERFDGVSAYIPLLADIF